MAESVNEAIQSVLESGRYTLETELESFEKEFAAYLDVRHAIGVGSGTDALRIGLMLADLGPGDEVITAPNTDNPTAAAIAQTGAKIVFADVDPRTFNIDPDRVRQAITEKTRVILPVHLFGQPADMSAICELAQENDVDVIEDAALAVGATHRGRMVGSYGRIGCFSLAPSKILGAAGDAGILVTDDADLAERARVLRNYGHAPGIDLDPKNLIGGTEWQVLEHGLNSRLDAIQAAVLRLKLATLDERLAGRRRAAALYDELLADLDLVVPFVSSGNVSSYYAYVVLAENRDFLRHSLASSGVATRLYYNPPLPLQPAFADLGRSRGSFPSCEYTSDRMLALPIFPQITESEIRFVASCLEDVVASRPNRDRKNDAIN